MLERAYKLFQNSWNNIKYGNFFDEKNNTIFEYTLKSIWNSEYKNPAKKDIIHNLPYLFSASKNLENPPPFLYVLISLRDNALTKIMQELAINDFVKENASESSTYQLLNFVETFNEKQLPIEDFIHRIIAKTKEGMNNDMVEALAYMTSINHPQFIKNWVEKLNDFNDKRILKNYVNMIGRRGLLALMQIVSPGEAKKILN
jgi:hypothetical protein